ncbi:MAG: phospholipase D-like domain-containing protein [Verrucomicrobiota bacterium]|nr:phospholipase D-like domain-containing protein [Verrucomicrobiota bacterium]
MEETILTKSDFWQTLFNQNWLNILFSTFGFILALLIIGRMISEKREPSNLFAWALLVFFLPWVGVPLYFMFGGRKSKRLVLAKRQALHLAERAAAASAGTEHNTKITGLSEVSSGNSVELLGDGVVSYRTLMEEINHAEKAIHIASYILGRDAVGVAIRDRLVKRASSGVQVRVLLDAFGSWGVTGRFLDPLRAAGGEVAAFMPVLPIQTHTSSNLRNHRKLAIFDHRRAITGGQNLDGRFIANRMSKDLFVDFNVRLAGPVVSSLNRVFIADWAFAARVEPATFTEILAIRPEPCGASCIETIASGPDVEGDPLWEKIITLVQECRSELTLVTPYFIPDEVLYRSLIVKAHAGRTIRLIVPENSNHPLVDMASNYYLRNLQQAGVEVLFYHGRMMHAKILLCDRKFALLGSANFDLRSLFVNFEIGLLHTTDTDVTMLYAWVDSIATRCLPLADTRRASYSNSRKRLEDFAHLVAPLL